MSTQASVRGESRRIVTVVFSDVAGSTLLGEDLDPESLRHLMIRYFEEMHAVVRRHGGITEKFIGDALMAVFGVPNLHEDDALRAVRACVEMREKLSLINDEFERSWGVRILARMGVNTGDVIAGDPTRGESFVVGDTVNVAARLEQAAEPGQIVIGESTFRLVHDAVIAVALPALTLRGKREPVTVMSLVNVRPHVPGWSRRLDSPLVDRDRELEMLEETYRRTASDRTCELVTVLGAAGVGKSRLASEFVARLGEEPRVLSGHCLSYGEGITFGPVVEVLHGVAAVGDIHGSEEARLKINELLGGTTHAPMIAERLAALMGMSGQPPGVQETFWAVRKFLESLASQRPLVLVFDDIHWGEPTFLDLLEYLAGWIEGVPMMLLCLARGDLLDIRGAWMTGNANGSQLILRPLTTAQTRGLIRSLLDGTSPPDAALAQLVDVSEGNPLFAEEMLRILVDDGRLRRENGRWALTGTATSMSIPPTIYALLAARLDRLGPQERAVIERASIIGRQFWWGAISELLPADERGGLGGCLQSLIRKEFIRPGRSDIVDEDTFQFAHILIRDAAYEGIPKLIRADLHERFAEWVAVKLRDRVGDSEETVGYHLEQAHRALADLGPAKDRTRSLAKRAAARLARAGERAFGRGDMPAAANLLARATALLPTTNVDRLGLLPILGKALRETGQLAGADAVLSEAIELAGRIEDRRIEALAHIERASLRDYTTTSGDPDELRRVAEHSIEVFDELGDDMGLAQASSLLAEAHWTRGQFAIMEDVLDRALVHAERAQDTRGRSFLLSALARALHLGPTPVDIALRRCADISARTGDDHMLAAAILPPAGGLHALRGEFEQARSHYQRARANFEEFGLRVALAALPLYSGPIELLAGNPAAAERELRRGRDLLADMGDRSRFSTVAAFLSRALYVQGWHDEADSAAVAAAKATMAYDFYTQALWRGTRALILATAGEAQPAEQLAREAVAFAKETDSVNLVGDALLDLAQVLTASGRAADAMTYAEEALHRYQEKGNRVSVRRAERLARP
jgi:class 3 adenylate cyclase/tetratricopeptide (TPR) repeat protein